MKYISAFFTESFSPKSGLAPMIDVVRLSDNTLVLNDEPMVESNLTGYYYYAWAAYDDEEEYAATADGGSSLDGVERYKYGAI